MDRHRNEGHPMNHSPEGTGVRDALEEILRVHANDNIRPKAFYNA